MFAARNVYSPSPYEGGLSTAPHKRGLEFSREGEAPSELHLRLGRTPPAMGYPPLQPLDRDSPRTCGPRSSRLILFPVSSRIPPPRDGLGIISSRGRPRGPHSPSAAWGMARRFSPETPIRRSVSPR